MKDNLKSINISILRIIATISVILLHTCSTILDNQSNYILNDNNLNLFLIGKWITTWAVPIFIMITGALLLNEKHKLIIKKYIFRIFLTLIVFGIPFALLILLFNGNPISISTILLSIKALIIGESFSHLWYLYMLIGIYLILPFIKKSVINSDEKDIRYILIVLFIFNFIVPFINNILDIKIAFTIPFSYCLFYLIFGYYLTKYDKLFDGKNYLNLVGICACTILIIIAIMFSDCINYIGSYNSPLIAIFSYLIFKYFINIDFSFLEKFKSNIWKIDRLCFGVYLIHPVFIHVFYKYFEITPLNFSNVGLFILVFFIIFTILSFVSSFVLRLIPFVKKYLL